MNQHICFTPVQRGFEEIANIFEIVQGRGYVAGSYAAWMCGGFDFIPGDIDIFATSIENADAIFEECYQAFRMYKGGVSSIAKVLMPFPDNPQVKPIQVVNPSPTWSIFPDDIIESFDLDIARAVLISPHEVMTDENVGSQYGKLLTINNPMRSLIRVMKYSKRGIVFEEWELLKLFRCWDAMSDDRKDTLINDIQLKILADELEMQNEESSDYRDDYDYNEDDYFDGE